MGKHRNSSRHALWQARWFNGRQWQCVQVRGEKQKDRLRVTLDALPWVSKVEFIRVGR